MFTIESGSFLIMLFDATFTGTTTGAQILRGQAAPPSAVPPSGPGEAYGRASP